MCNHFSYYRIAWVKKIDTEDNRGLLRKKVNKKRQTIDGSELTQFDLSVLTLKQLKEELGIENYYKFLHQVESKFVKVTLQI